MKGLVMIGGMAKLAGFVAKNVKRGAALRGNM